jgi:hypothetical protein
MSDTATLTFDNPSKLGKVTAVDTSRVIVAVENSSLLPRAAVGSLCAIQGSTAQEFLIGMTERVTRQLKEQTAQPDPLAPTTLLTEMVPDDMIRLVLLGTYRTIEGTARNRFKRGADSFPQIDRECFLIEGGNLQRFMNLLGSELEPSQRLELGRFVLDPDAVAIANGDKFFQRHAAILGSTGSGKSYAVALILERAFARKFPNIIVFDMHGEYVSMESAITGSKSKPEPQIAQVFKIAGPGDLDSPTKSSLFLPYWLLNREEMLSMILERGDNNAPNQIARFTSHVWDLKAETLTAEKKNKIAATFTVDSPIPYDLKELVARLESDNTEEVASKVAGKTKAGDWAGKLTRLIGRLKVKIEDRRYGFMFKPPTDAQKYDWLAGQATKLLASEPGKPGIKIIDFSEVPSDVLPVVTAVFARLLYDVQFWMESRERTPFVFICDEAHLYLPKKDDADAVEKQSLYVFERIAKEGRKYSVSLLVVSQRPSDVSRTILSQCNNFLVLRLTNDEDQNVVRRLMPDSLAGVLDALPMMDTGEGILLGDAVLLPARIRLNTPRVPPLSATRDFWREWGERQPNLEAIARAVETLRSQSRAPSPTK